ncbi:hypothetical protein [Aliamphritea hakodatensis]|uniref:hypothetical protein n=1 Tax=Aliamphritea hakodatensis TaxID=2895352 RepID=UPI0022FD6501|nr:hypothetical protein [Aliamphritea hakodatensis]
MIRIDSVTQPNIAGAASSQKAAVSSTFADLLAEEAARLADAAKSKQEEAPTTATATEEKSTVNHRDELMRLLSMSPAELIRYQMLDEMGLTEESLKNLPYEERMKIEEMIREEIERQLGGKEGIGDIASQTL